MRIEEARYEGGELRLKTGSPDARRLAYKFKPGEYELKKARAARSLDANAYCWVLCTKIAEVSGVSKEQVYIDAVQEGNQFCMSSVADEDYESFVRAWQSRGLGWRVQLVDDAGMGSKTVFAYYGSSVYDSKAMSKLIDSLVETARDLGIETMPEDEVRALLEEWN